METRTLGRTRLHVSALGLGGIKFGAMDQAVVDELVAGAIDSGINIIDTARGYGDSEQRLGHALVGRRDKVILSSKSGARTAPEMRKELETSLRLLKTDYIDIYMAHNLRLADEYDLASGPGGAVEELERARDEGLIRHVAISCHRYQDTFARAIESGRFDVVMVAYNMLNDELMDERILPLARQHNIGTLIMKPLGGGVLGHAPETVTLEGSTGAITPADAIAFVLANPNVDCAVVGMQTVAELEEDVAAVARAGDLGAEAKSAMVEAAEALGKDFCRACGYCQPCPSGILIPVILRHLFYAKQYGLVEWSRGRYGMVEIKADTCTRCEECLPKCPYDLAIPDLLEEVHALLG